MSTDHRSSTQSEIDALEMSPDAKSSFFVASFGPTEMRLGHSLQVSGLSLDKVNHIFVMGSEGERIPVPFSNGSASHVEIKFPSWLSAHLKLPTFVFAILHDGKTDWFPCGPVVISKSEET